MSGKFSLGLFWEWISLIQPELDRISGCHSFFLRPCDAVMYSSVSVVPKVGEKGQRPGKKLSFPCAQRTQTLLVIRYLESPTQSFQEYSIVSSLIKFGKLLRQTSSSSPTRMASATARYPYGDYPYSQEQVQVRMTFWSGSIIFVHFDLCQRLEIRWCSVSTWDHGAK